MANAQTPQNSEKISRLLKNITSKPANSPINRWSRLVVARTPIGRTNINKRTADTIAYAIVFTQTITGPSAGMREAMTTPINLQMTVAKIANKTASQE